jgi:hypothetical protein
LTLRLRISKHQTSGYGIDVTKISEVVRMKSKMTMVLVVSIFALPLMAQMNPGGTDEVSHHSPE